MSFGLVFQTAPTLKLFMSSLKRRIFYRLIIANPVKFPP